MHDCQLLFFPWYTSNNFSFIFLFYRSHRTFMSQHDSHCFAQYFHIKFQAPVRNITAIKCYHLFKIRNLTAPAYLPHPGDPRFVARRLLWCSSYFTHSSSVGGRVPTRDISPLSTFQNCGNSSIDQSRILFPSPFFYRSVRQTPAADDARVKIQFKHHSVRYTVFCSKCCFALLRIQIHTAEFIARKFLAILSDPGLSEEDRTGRFMIDHRCKDQKQNSCEDASDDASENIPSTV